MHSRPLFFFRQGYAKSTPRFYKRAVTNKKSGIIPAESACKTSLSGDDWLRNKRLRIIDAQTRAGGRRERLPTFSASDLAQCRSSTRLRNGLSLSKRIFFANRASLPSFTKGRSKVDLSQRPLYLYARLIALTKLQPSGVTANNCSPIERGQSFGSVGESGNTCRAPVAFQRAVDFAKKNRRKKQVPGVFTFHHWRRTARDLYGYPVDAMPSTSFLKSRSLLRHSLPIHLLLLH